MSELTRERMAVRILIEVDPDDRAPLPCSVPTCWRPGTRIVHSQHVGGSGHSFRTPLCEEHTLTFIGNISDPAHA